MCECSPQHKARDGGHFQVTCSCRPFHARHGLCLEWPALPQGMVLFAAVGTMPSTWQWHHSCTSHPVELLTPRAQHQGLWSRQDTTALHLSGAYMLLAWLAMRCLPSKSTSGCGLPDAKMARPPAHQQHQGQHACLQCLAQTQYHWPVLASIAVGPQAASPAPKPAASRQHKKTDQGIGVKETQPADCLITKSCHPGRCHQHESCPKLHDSIKLLHVVPACELAMRGGLRSGTSAESRHPPCQGGLGFRVTGAHQ